MSLILSIWNRPSQVGNRIRNITYSTFRLEHIVNRIKEMEFMSVLLLVSLLLMVGSISYAVAVPAQNDRATEFALLMEAENGEYVAEGYPETFERGETQSVVLELTNKEPSASDYTIVVVAQRVEQIADSSEETVTEQAELSRISVIVDSTETRYLSQEVTPTITGDKVRIRFLLFKGTELDEPTSENPHRVVQLVTTVSESENSPSSA